MKINDRDKVIRELAQLRFQGAYTRQAMVEWLMTTYDLKLSRAYELIREMMDEVADLYEKTNPNALVDAIEFMEHMKFKCVGEGDKKMALDYQKELNKIKQLHIQKMDITTGGDKITSINISIIKPDDKDNNGD